MKTTHSVMGMPITVLIVSDDDLLANNATKAAFEEFYETDRTFSTYKPDSEISRINRHELDIASASPEVKEVLGECEELRKMTGGYFDINRDGRIDPSGLVKGWSIGRAAKKVETLGIRNFFIEAGGDITLRGHNEDGQTWRVGIRNPNNLDEIVKVLEISEGSVCTSGTYARGEHIYNPITGKPALEMSSVTVVGPDVAASDAIATAAFAKGAAGIQLIAEMGLEAYVILRSGKAVFTRGMEKYFL
jgi:thiamine biosynthesis lipoprotein